MEQKPLCRSSQNVACRVPSRAQSRLPFCEDRIRGFGVAMGGILAFSIDLLRRTHYVLSALKACRDEQYKSITTTTANNSNNSNALWRFGNTISEFCAYVHCALRLFTSIRSNIWPPYSLRRLRFDIRQMLFHYRVTYTGYIGCRWATTSHDLDLWPFDLESVSCTVLLMSHAHSYYPTTIGYWVTSTEYLITFPFSETVTAHAPCHVNHNWRQN